MRLAVVVLTDRAYKLAQKLTGQLVSEPTLVADIYCSAKLQAKELPQYRYFANLSVVTKQLFSIYDGLVFIMATGIVVRTIAPLLQDKLHDPAVVVFDENGQHGISLLSGHVGGGNALTNKLCELIKAEPVITTATDVNNKLAPDVIANKLTLQVWPKANIKTINKAVLVGSLVKWQLSPTLKAPQRDFYCEQLSKLGQIVIADSKSVTDNDYTVIITNELAKAKEKLAANQLVMSPSRLIAGVGCRAGTEKATIMAALTTACNFIGVTTDFITEIVTTEVKSQERGLLMTAQELACPIKFFTNSELAASITKYQLKESPFVKKTIGVGNVCEAAVYAEAQQGGVLALPKTKFVQTTVALLWEK